MTYPQVTVRGEKLPEPFDGWDDNESLTMLDADGRREAVYRPSEYSVERKYLYLKWDSDELTEHRYIYNSQIESFDVTYDHDGI